MKIDLRRKDFFSLKVSTGQMTDFAWLIFMKISYITIRFLADVNFVSTLDNMFFRKGALKQQDIVFYTYIKYTFTI